VGASDGRARTPHVNNSEDQVNDNGAIYCREIDTIYSTREEKGNVQEGMKEKTQKHNGQEKEAQSIRNEKTKNRRCTAKVNTKYRS
jgi:3'-phosphoadenosine 5'-phosphosulfate (PAPS) 3'-phosphatase